MRNKKKIKRRKRRNEMEAHLDYEAIPRKLNDIRPRHKQ